MCPLILCSHVKVPLSLLSVAVALLCAACAFGQTVAYQFKAGDFTATTDSATWAAAGGGSVMTSVHSATNGWSLAVKEGGAVCFDNGVSSPLGFPDSATNTVAYAFAVVECSEPSNHATLIDAPCSIRFIPSLFDDSATRFYERQINNAVALSINGTETNVFTAATLPQLVEVAFDSPCALNGIYVGGAPATAAWGQSWRGAVAELILLADTPTDERLNALRRYLALKHGLAVPTESDGGIVATLAAMGVDTDGLFNSVFLVK